MKADNFIASLAGFAVGIAVAAMSVKTVYGWHAEQSVFDDLARTHLAVDELKGEVHELYLIQRSYKDLLGAIIKSNEEIEQRLDMLSYSYR